MVPVPAAAASPSAPARERQGVVALPAPVLAQRVLNAAREALPSPASRTLPTPRR